MGYIIVIARLPGIYGNVNRPCPQAAPSDSGRFTAINPWSHAITITYQLFYYIDYETAIQHLMTSCMPEGGKYKLYFPLYPSGRENILVIHRLV